MQTSENHYNELHKYYLSFYGFTFQAHRPTDIKELHSYLNKQIAFKKGDKVLDAGCGVCGPAIYFAKKNRISIDAITNSVEQIETAQELIYKNKLGKQIQLHLNDFHHIEKMFQPKSFDKILFLESFGHSESKGALLSASYNLLKLDGTLYIKDYFAAEIIGGDERKILMKKAVENLKREYCYYLSDLYETIETCRTLGFQIEFIQKPNFKLNNEDVVGGFEKELNINLFESDYKPIIVEPLEIKLKKVMKDKSI
jgi:SAM-dependent methyltransferase